MVDDLDVEVRNKNLDRTCLVDELSGGQFVLVPEWFSGAIGAPPGGSQNGGKESQVTEAKRLQ